MDQADIRPTLSELSSDITRLTSSLAPLLEAPTSSIASKLPLLDKAKLHILTTYAIESLLFSSLRLSGVEAKEHAVFRELARTRQYFEKVKKAEEGPQKRTFEVDKAAAGRFIKHGLAGNAKLDRERASDQERQKSAAKRKLEELEADVAEASPSNDSNKDSTQREGKKSKKKSKKKAHKSSVPPKSGHEAFQALMHGSNDQG